VIEAVPDQPEAARFYWYCVRLREVSFEKGSFWFGVWHGRAIRQGSWLNHGSNGLKDFTDISAHGQRIFRVIGVINFLP
jgi:hypothetical protein